MRTFATSPGTITGTESIVKTARVITVGSSLETICGAGAVVLAILGLLHVLTPLMMAVGAIAAGAALLFEGGAVASRFRELERDLNGDSVAQGELAGGTSLEIIGGTGAVVLGILALVGIQPVMFPAIAIIAIGAALLFGSGATTRLDTLSMRRVVLNDASAYSAHESIMAASGLQVLAGVAGVALGILALLSIATETLILVGILALGGAILLSGSAIVGKMATLLGG